MNEWTFAQKALVVLAGLQLLWALAGFVSEPSFHLGADAPTAKVLGVDFNGYHALSGFLLFLPAFYFARRPDWAFYYDAYVAVALFATGIWAFLDEQPAWVFSFPDNASDGIFHLVTGTIFAVPRGSSVRGMPSVKGEAPPEKIVAVTDRFQEPGWFTKHVFNRIVAVATKLGLSVAGSRVLEVKGRKSGEWRRTPVNLLEFEGARYLVAPRGNTQWVRNMRVSGGGRLVLGHRTEEFTAKEVPEDERVPLLRAYLEKWKWEVGAFFDGVGPDSSDAELRRIAPDHPAFRID